MAGIIAIVLATLWTAFVVETIIESARAFGGSIIFLGRTLFMPGVQPGILSCVDSRQPPGSPGRPRSHTSAAAGSRSGWPRSSTRAIKR